jgi:NifU-like protein involved in Fe-S cluster formation
MDYNPEVLQRFASPQRAGGFMEGLEALVVGEAEDRSLNVWVRFQVQVADNRLEQVRFEVFGCPHTVAAASWLAQRLEGKAVDALTRLDMQEVAQALDVPLEKMGKLLRIEDALHAVAVRAAIGSKRKDTK